MALWITCCLVAVIVLIRNRSTMLLFSPEYRRFLLQPWKVTTFVISASGMVVVAPYTGDPTWDYVDASVMSVLCYLTAPWAIGTLYRVIRGRERPMNAYLALCVWLFSASWVYDTWLLIRDGRFPVTMWWPNLMASSSLYVMAGLFWNLDWRPARGTVFSFMEPDWPTSHGGPVFIRSLWIGGVFMAVVGIMVLLFLLR
jgi:hypothetical protein